jgi:hypothetical protein
LEPDPISYEENGLDETLSAKIKLGSDENLTSF